MRPSRPAIIPPHEMANRKPFANDSGFDLIDVAVGFEAAANYESQQNANACADGRGEERPEVVAGEKQHVQARQAPQIACR